MKTVTCAVFGLVAILLALVSPASAGTISGQVTQGATGTSYSYTAGPEVNKLGISLAPRTIVFTEYSPQAPIRVSRAPCTKRGINVARCRASGPGDNISVSLGGGSDLLVILGGRVKLALGGSGNDVMRGAGYGEELNGGPGNDRIDARGGGDRIIGGNGLDLLVGGPGNDAINSADIAQDTVNCGPGVDTVRANRNDRLTACENVTRV